MNPPVEMGMTGNFACREEENVNDEISDIESNEVKQLPQIGNFNVKSCQRVSQSQHDLNLSRFLAEAQIKLGLDFSAFRKQRIEHQI
jgi:hypothetical protein